MQKSKSDHFVFYLNVQVQVSFWLVVYVDDIVITGSDSKGISSLMKSYSQSQFHTKEPRDVKILLGH